MRTAVALFDDDLAYLLASRTVRQAREAGALATLPVALNSLSSVLVLIGELARAGELLAELDVITRETGGAPLLQARVLLAGAASSPKPWNCMPLW